MAKKVIFIITAAAVCACALATAALQWAQGGSAGAVRAHALSDEAKARYKTPGENGKISLNFSPYYTDGARPGVEVPEEAIRRLLNAIAPFCDTIRTFSASEYAALYPIAKREYDMRILAGAWLTGDEAADKKELDALIKLANSGLADLLLTGSEGLHRGDYTGEYAIQCMDYVKKALTDKSIPVSTSDTAGAWLDDRSGLINRADFLCYTYYPYFEGVAADKGARAFEKNHARLKAKSLGKPIICSETAYPDGGEKIGGAVPSAENSVRYFDDMRAWSAKAGVEAIIFEAVDERWKGSPESAEIHSESAEIHFGICDTFGAVKPQYWESLLEIIKADAAENERR
jgi:GPH family glycoside/pentoside/hexuronide:cation symporter